MKTKLNDWNEFRSNLLVALCITFLSFYLLCNYIYIWERECVIFRVTLNNIIVFNNILLNWYFKNSTVELYMLYILCTYVKFHIN